MADNEKRAFLRHVLMSGGRRVDQVADLLWFNQEHGHHESGLDEIISDLEAAGMARQNRPRLARQILRSKHIIKGTKPRCIRLAPAAYADRKKNYARNDTPDRSGDEYVLTAELPDRRPIRKVAQQLNACYSSSFYDAAAAMARRLAEMLVIEVYVSSGRVGDIQQNGTFMMLDGLIAKLAADKTLARSRTMVRDLYETKAVGDTASHSRSHVTSKTDMDDLAFRYRRLISDLVELANVRRSGQGNE